MPLELTCLIPLVGSLAENPLAVKHLDNRLYIMNVFNLNLFTLKKIETQQGANFPNAIIVYENLFVSNIVLL